MLEFSYFFLLLLFAIAKKKKKYLYKSKKCFLKVKVC